MIKDNVLREQLSSRGGGVEIDLTYFGYEGEKMTAYQNYLGGGMLGAIGNDCTIQNWSDMALIDLAFELRIYYCKRMGLDMEYADSNLKVGGMYLPLSAY